MKPTDNDGSPDELRPEYDFSGGVRGKYVARFRDGACLPAAVPSAENAVPTPDESTKDSADAG